MHSILHLCDINIVLQPDLTVCGLHTAEHICMQIMQQSQDCVHHPIACSQLNWQTVTQAWTLVHFTLCVTTLLQFLCYLCRSFLIMRIAIKQVKEGVVKDVREED